MYTQTYPLRYFDTLLSYRNYSFCVRRANTIYIFVSMSIVSLLSITELNVFSEANSIKQTKDQIKQNKNKQTNKETNKTENKTNKRNKAQKTNT